MRAVRKGAFMTGIGLCLTAILAALLPASLSEASHVRADDSAGKEIILKAADITSKLMPETVYFRGQTAPVQLRNSAGVHFSDDLYTLAAIVDSSGYSSGIREKYQGYLITEVTLDFGGHAVQPGAYGFGFLNGGKFVVMDLGAHDLFQGASQRDTELKHPVPLQIAAATAGGTYRLYAGRDFVEFHRVR
jgi:hypothetical protein